MNEVLKCINERRSIRNFRKEMPSRHELETLVSAAFESPSAKNGQPWHITVCTNKEINDGVVAGVRNYHKQAGSYTEGMEQYHNFYNAPCVMYLHAKTDEMRYAANDIGIMAQTVALAAHSTGLGTCIIWNVLPAFKGPDRGALFEKLGIPEGYEPYTAIAVGYANGEMPQSRGRDKTKVNYVG